MQEEKEEKEKDGVNTLPRKKRKKKKMSSPKIYKWNIGTVQGEIYILEEAKTEMDVNIDKKWFIK